MERTLAIIKPDAVQRNLIGQILTRLETKEFVILGMKIVFLSKQDAERFYHVHRERPFFESLTTYMASGPIVPLVLQRERAIETLRDIMGTTNPTEAAAGTIRKTFALDIEKNSIHGSDSMESASTEIPFFFNHLEFRERP